VKKPADKTNLRILSGVCTLIRKKGDNQISGFHRTRDSAAHKGGDLPTPAPFSAHAYENNDVTSIMTMNACQNKQHTSRGLTEIRARSREAGFSAIPDRLAPNPAERVQ
jgi:hypothetical protein